MGKHTTPQPEEPKAETRQIPQQDDPENRNDQSENPQTAPEVDESGPQGEEDPDKARKDKERRDKNTSVATTTLGMLIVGAIILTVVAIKWIGGGDDDEEPGNISAPSASPTAEMNDDTESGGERETKSTPEQDNSPDQEKPNTQPAKDYPVPEDDLLQKTDLGFLSSDYYAGNNDEENAAIAQSIQNTIDTIPTGDDLDIAQVASDYALGSEKQAMIMGVSGQNGWHVNNLQAYTRDENEPRKVAFTIDDGSDTPMFFVAGLYDPVQDLFELDTYSATKEGAKSGAVL